MWTPSTTTLPPGIAELEEATHEIQFFQRADLLTLSLLRTLAAGKPGGRFLELGTGTGVSACWIRDGMDAQSQLTTVDGDEQHFSVAQRFLGDDPRIHCTLEDGKKFIDATLAEGKTFDFISVDMELGKYSYLNEVLQLLAPGGMYVIDHLLPQPSWSEGRAAQVEKLVSTLEQRSDLRVTRLDWNTGMLIATKVAHN